MKELFERGTLWLILSILLVSCRPELTISPYILTGFIISCLGIFMEYRYFNLLFTLCFAGITLFFPYMGVYLGIVCYQIFFHPDDSEKAEFFLLFPPAVFFCSHIGKDFMIQKIFYLLAVLLSIHLAVTLRDFLIYQEQLLKVRDDNTEKQALLRSQYRSLQEQQNNELKLAALSERNRIAREIHDNVGHTLSRSILQLGALLTIHRGTAVEVQLLPLKSSLDEAMNNIRESVHDLHRESVDFKASVSRMISEMKDYQITFSCDLWKNLPVETAYSFIAITKEAFTNICRHSDADAVKVTARELSNYYQLIIEDNGTKAIDTRKKTDGIGLKNMEDRIKSLHGLIYFSNANGFRIFISVPKEPNEKTMEVRNERISGR